MMTPLLLILGLLASPGGVADAAKTAPVRHTRAELKLPISEKIPRAARESLRSRMDRHGDDMTLLMAAVLMLNYEMAEDLARSIHSEPKLSRPGPGELDTLNAQLPPVLFDLQDQLSVRAQGLIDAAHARDAKNLVKAFGAMSETCVACHSAFLRENVP